MTRRTRTAASMPKQARPVLSIGMIFRNDIRCIERCLKSLRPLREAVPCELVMADTGSDDGSRSVAEQYADTVFDFHWIDDFSAARNAVLDRCSGKWFLALDTDHWLDKDIHDIVDLFTHPAKWRDRTGFTVSIRNYTGDDLSPDVYSDQVSFQIVRMSTGARYTGVIHERWDERPRASVAYLKFLIHHDGYVGLTKEQGLAKRERNMVLLRRELEQNPNDLRTLKHCYDSCADDERPHYVRLAMEGVRQRFPKWELWGSVICGNAVSWAYLCNMPELENWISEAEKLFPGSIHIRVDMCGIALRLRHTQKRFAEAVSYGERYLRGLSDYRRGKYNKVELTMGTLHAVSPAWENLNRTYLVQSYYETGAYEKARDLLDTIDASCLNAGIAGNFVSVMANLQSHSDLDIGPKMAAFWEVINKLVPTEKEAEKRRDAVRASAARLFTRDFRELEDREGLRHAYTLLLPLEGKSELGRAAAILETTEPSVLEEKLAAVERWAEIPIWALSHALAHGAAFPLPDRPLKLEEMDALAARLAADKETLFSLATGALPDGPQDICWMRALVIAAVQNCDWEDAERGMALARAFADTEREFLPLCYAPSALEEDCLFLLPPTHRFGWYCARAFEALDSGDTVGYVRLLRAGLGVCGNVKDMKDMVEFLVEHTPELQAPTPSPELFALAGQIQTILTNFDPDDPAVVALKQSEAYQKVAWIIEGASVPVIGELIQ